MKQLRTFRLLVVCIMMFCNLNLFADGLITEQVVVNVEEAGTLSTKISSVDKYRITDLKIIGKLNVSDFDFIYTMTKGADKNLNALDLGDVELVADEEHDMEMPRIVFSKCICLTSLVLPKRMTSIGVQAFLGCVGLTSLVLPESLTSVGVDAFWGCSGLTSLVLPESLIVIGNYAFRNSGLTSITFLSSSITIRLNSFSGCNNLHSLYLTSKEYVDVIGLGKSGFSKDCVVYVPKGMLQTYKSSIWGTYFKEIVEYDATGIDDVSISSTAKPLSRYSVNGQRLTSPTKGLNIVKYSDGSVRKEMVK